MKRPFRGYLKNRERPPSVIATSRDALPPQNFNQRNICYIILYYRRMPPSLYGKSI